MKIPNRFSGEEYMEIAATGLKQAKNILSLGAAASGRMAEVPKFRLHDILISISDRISNSTGELARVISTETGKPLKYSRMEAVRAATVFRMAAEETPKIGGETLPLDLESGTQNRIAISSRTPVGLIYTINPFSEPLGAVAQRVAAALATGNAIISKPSSLAPVSSLKLAEIIRDTDLPENSMQNVLAAGESHVNRHMISSREVQMIAFTGERCNAERVTKIAGVKRTSLELGSNSPVIVWDDADLDLAAESIVNAAFESQGQNPLHTQRVLVKSEAYEYLKNRIVELASHLKAGDPLDEETDFGPMITEEEAARVEAEVKSARDNGAYLLFGGGREGSFHAPTILENVPESSGLWRNEIFGPVLCLGPVKSFEESIRLSNGTESGIQAGIFTSDMNLAFTAIEKLNYGTVLINDSSNFRSEYLPISSISKAGGGRRGIRYAMEEMTGTKLAIIKR